MDLDTPGSVWRKQRWLDAGSPAADLRRLQYAGADRVRWILRRALLVLPPEVRHFCLEAVDWIEVGGDGAGAWAHHQPAPRALPGDIGHRIVIKGDQPDRALPGLIGHEISHRWRKPVCAEVPPPQPLATVDLIAVKIYVESRTQTEAERWLERACWIGSSVAEELRADEQARAWGFDWRGHDEDDLRRRFSRQYDEAVRMAGLAAELDAATLKEAG